MTAETSSSPADGEHSRPLRTALICSESSLVDHRLLAAQLAAGSELTGILLIRNSPRQRGARFRREWKRSGWRLLDVLAFRVFYNLRLAARDRAWIRTRTTEELERLPAPPIVPVHETEDPNSENAREFLASLGADAALAACKTILRPEIFAIPAQGTFVVHPGICPEYRNAHGCFWALARRDLGRVGATLLRIDEGVDTGPVYAYYEAEFDDREDSHVMVQFRVVCDHLRSVLEDMKRACAGELAPLDVSGRTSRAWGQPRLSDYARWKLAARRNRS